MTDWKTVHDSRPDQPPELDTTSSKSTVYVRRNIQRETVQDSMGEGSVQQWVYEQKTYTREEYTDLMSPAMQTLMQGLNDQTLGTAAVIAMDSTSTQQTVMQAINQQTLDIMSAIAVSGGK